MKNLSNAVKTVRLKPDGSGWTVSAGTSDVTSDVVDVAGFDALRFVVGFGAITAGAATAIKLQQGAEPNLSDAADLAGSRVIVADTGDNKMAIVDAFRPQKRYLRVVTSRATQNSAVDFALCELYRADTEPVTQDATVIAAEIHASPAEGTA
jgi:hypothetical protein